MQRLSSLRGDLLSVACRAQVQQQQPGAVSYSGDPRSLADVYVPCEVCEGRRFKPETLEILFELDELDEIKICTGYSVDGEELLMMKESDIMGIIE